MWAATAGVAVALGPVTGGWLLEHFWWGSVLMINVPVIAVALVAIALIVPTSRDTTIKRFDPVGTLASIAGVTTLVWAVIEGPEHGWASTTSILAFALAAVLLAGFVAWERRIDHPMLDVKVFSNMRFSAGSLAITFSFFSLFGFIFVVTQYFQFIRGYSALEAGVRTVPFAVFMASTAPLSAKLTERVGTKLVVTGGMVSMAVGFVIATTNGVDTPYGVIVLAMMFMGGGLGLVAAPATEAIMGSLPPAKAGVGSAVNDTARELGGTLGVAIVGSVFSSIYGARLTDALAGTPMPDDALAVARESVGAAKEVGRADRRDRRPRGRGVRRQRREPRVHRRLARRLVGLGRGRPARRACSPGASSPPGRPAASPRRTCIQMLRQSATIRCKNGWRWAPVASADVSSTPSASVAETAAALTEHGYLPDDGLATAVYLAMSLRRPLLLEGEAGVGKTEVAKVLAAWTGGELIRLQCYEGIDAAQAVYDWDYGRQLLHLRAAEASGESAGRSTDALEAELYQERFLIKRALLLAIERREGPPPVLLVDEIDRADDEFEAYLLEVLSDWQITIPELGVFRASDPPVVVLTSNRTRDVHDALKRRCLYHWVEHPDFDREVAIVRLRAPEVAEPLARQVAAAVEALRGLALYKPPGVAETIDWATALGRLGATELDERSVEATLGTVLKYREDHERVEQHGFADIVKQAFERGAVRT